MDTKFRMVDDKERIRQLMAEKREMEVIVSQLEDALLELSEVASTEEKALPKLAKIYQRKIEIGEMTLEEAPVKLRGTIEARETGGAEDGESIEEPVGPPVEKPGKGKS
jgi:hypothetical protein